MVFKLSVIGWTCNFVSDKLKNIIYFDVFKIPIKINDRSFLALFIKISQLLLGLDLLAQIAKLLTRHQVFFNVLKGNTFSFRDQQKSYHDEDQIKPCVEPKCPCRTYATQK